MFCQKKITKKDLNFRGHLLILQAWSPSHFFEKHMGLQAGHLRTAATWTAHRQTMQARDLHRTDAAPQFQKYPQCPSNCARSELVTPAQPNKIGARPTREKERVARDVGENDMHITALLQFFAVFSHLEQDLICDCVDGQPTQSRASWLQALHSSHPIAT